MKINIHMRSGNVISLRGIKNFEVKSVGNEVTRLAVERSWLGRLFFARLLVSSINLQQIDAVTVGGL